MSRPTPTLISTFPPALENLIRSCEQDEYVYLTWIAFAPSGTYPRKTGRLDWSEQLKDFPVPSLLGVARDRGWKGECIGTLSVELRKLKLGEVPRLPDGTRSPEKWGTATVNMPDTGAEDEDEDGDGDGEDLDLETVEGFLGKGLEFLDKLGERMRDFQSMQAARAAMKAEAGAVPEVLVLQGNVERQTRILESLAGQLAEEREAGAELRAELRALRAELRNRGESGTEAPAPEPEPESASGANDLDGDGGPDKVP